MNTQTQLKAPFKPFPKAKTTEQLLAQFEASLSQKAEALLQAKHG